MSEAILGLARFCFHEYGLDPALVDLNLAQGVFDSVRSTSIFFPRVSAMDPLGVRELRLHVRRGRGEVALLTLGFNDLSGIGSTFVFHPDGSAEVRSGLTRWWILDGYGEPLPEEELPERPAKGQDPAGDPFTPWHQPGDHLHGPRGCEGIHGFGTLDEVRAKLRAAQRGMSPLPVA